MMQEGKSWSRATIESKHKSPRSYIVNRNGKRFRRNRRMLRPTRSPKPPPRYVPDIPVTNSTQNYDSDNLADIGNPDLTQIPMETEIVRTRSVRIVNKPVRYQDYLP